MWEKRERSRSLPVEEGHKPLTLHTRRVSLSTTRPYGYFAPLQSNIRRAAQAGKSKSCSTAFSIKLGIMVSKVRWTFMGLTKSRNMRR